MKLTMLVVECFSAKERDDDAFYSLLTNLKSRLAWNLEVENLSDRSFPKAKLTKTAADQNMVNLRSRISEALLELAILFSSDCDATKARRAWDWIFQSDGFSKELEEEAKAEANHKALSEKVTLLASGKAGTDRSGRIVVASASTIPNLAHTFYGETF